MMRRLLQTALLAAAIAAAGAAAASEGEKPRNIAYPEYPAAPASQGAAQAAMKSFGCITCHEKTDQPTMHENPGVVLGCTDCHGGDAAAARPEGSHDGDAAYRAALDKAHVQPRYPGAWQYPRSANPERSYTLLNRESPEFIRFVNPSDYRIARESCGACHLPIIQAAERSIMATGA